MYQIGSGLLSSGDIKITTRENEEILESPPSNWPQKTYSLYRFEIINYDACHLLINEKYRIYLDEQQGFETTPRDIKIFSVKIEEPNVKYNYIGGY